MKKYALMIVASGLFCMLHVQPSEKSRKVFKHDLLKAVASLNEVYGGRGLNYRNIWRIANWGKEGALLERIPLNDAVSIVISTLTQRVLEDMQKVGITNEAVKQEACNGITQIVWLIFGSE